jgi:hypothetical protein
MLAPVSDVRADDAIPRPSKDRRWDIDARGDGVADASALGARIDELRAHTVRPLWVAEEPDVHLWPHLERAIRATDSPWTGFDWSIDGDGRLVVELAHPLVEGDRPRAALQVEVLKLLGHVVESSTYLEIERQGDGVLVVDVVTGVLDDQSPFKAHGHTLRFRVAAR